MITLLRFRRLEHALRSGGLGDLIEWSENIKEPRDAEEFAVRAIYVICNSGMRATVATPIFERCIASLGAGASATDVFNHPGKGPAIDTIWQQRHELFHGFDAASAKLDFLESLPWIGPVTKYHLAKNLGADTAKPDVHLERLARRERTTTERLCRRLASLTGYRVATVDTILWRSCADGILSSRRYELMGWKAAFRGTPVSAQQILLPADG